MQTYWPQPRPTKSVSGAWGPPSPPLPHAWRQVVLKDTEYWPEAAFYSLGSLNLWFGLCQCLGSSCFQQGALLHRPPLVTAFSSLLPLADFSHPTDSAMLPPLPLPNIGATLCFHFSYWGQRRTLDCFLFISQTVGATHFNGLLSFILFLVTDLDTSSPQRWRRGHYPV